MRSYLKTQQMSQPSNAKLNHEPRRSISTGLFFEKLAFCTTDTIYGKHFSALSELTLT